MPQRGVESSILESLVYCYTRLPSLTGVNDEEDDDNIQSGSSSSSSSSSGGAGAGGGGKRKAAGSKSSKKSKARIDHCKWQGMLKDALGHFNECNYVVVKCGFEGCVDAVLRSEFAEHGAVCAHRILKCKWAACEQQFQQLQAAEKDQHELVCPKRVMRCPNAGCKKMIFPEGLARYRLTCDYEMCACPFADVAPHECFETRLTNTKTISARNTIVYC